MKNSKLNPEAFLDVKELSSLENETVKGGTAQTKIRQQQQQTTVPKNN